MDRKLKVKRAATPQASDSNCKKVTKELECFAWKQIPFFHSYEIQPRESSCGCGSVQCLHGLIFLRLAAILLEGTFTPRSDVYFALIYFLKPTMFLHELVIEIWRHCKSSHRTYDDACKFLTFAVSPPSVPLVSRRFGQISIRFLPRPLPLPLSLSRSMKFFSSERLSEI